MQQAIICVYSRWSPTGKSRYWTWVLSLRKRMLSHQMTTAHGPRFPKFHQDSLGSIGSIFFRQEQWVDLRFVEPRSEAWIEEQQKLICKHMNDDIPNLDQKPSNFLQSIKWELWWAFDKMHPLHVFAFECHFNILFHWKLLTHVLTHFKKISTRFADKSVK